MQGDKRDEAFLVTAVIAVCSIGILAVLFQIGWYETPPTPEPSDEQLPLICYEPYGKPVELEFQARSVFINVNWLDGPLPDGSEGAAYWAYDPVTGVSGCEIFVPVPTQVLGDPAMDTLGHELLHCIGGNFHGE